MTLEEAYDRYGPQAYRHALALTRQRADAEDVVQGVFLKLAGRLRSRKERAEIADMEAYLHAAIHRESLTVLGRKRPAPLGAEAAAGLVAARNGAGLEETERVNRALGALPPEQREVVLLHVYQDMTFDRIGQALGIPLQTAASRYRYAREKLKELLHGD